MEKTWTKSGIIKGSGIPQPSGAYEVGCVHLLHEGIFVRLYYPTESSLAENYDFARWVFHKKYITSVLKFCMMKFYKLLGGLANIFIDPKIPARLGAPLLGFNPTTTSQSSATNNGFTMPSQMNGVVAPPTFPVIVFSHGIGSSFFPYSSVCCDLASHGFVVAALEHRDGSSCCFLHRVAENGVKKGDYDNYRTYFIPHFQAPKDYYPFRHRQNLQRSEEASECLALLRLLNEGDKVENMLGHMGCPFDFNQFKGRLNTDLSVIVGHSFGASTVIQTLHDDPNFSCGISLDPWMYPLGPEMYSSGVIKQPLLFVNSLCFQLREPFNLEKLEALFKSVTTVSVCTIKGAGHATQSDAAFIIPDTIPLDPEMTSSDIEKYLCHRLNTEICLAFLKRHLLKDPKYQCNVPVLDGGEGASEHIIYGTDIEQDPAFLKSKLSTEQSCHKSEYKGINFIKNGTLSVYMILSMLFVFLSAFVYILVMLF